MIWPAVPGRGRPVAGGRSRSVRRGRRAVVAEPWSPSRGRLAGEPGLSGRRSRQASPRCGTRCMQNGGRADCCDLFSMSATRYADPARVFLVYRCAPPAPPVRIGWLPRTEEGCMNPPASLAPLPSPACRSTICGPLAWCRARCEPFGRSSKARRMARGPRAMAGALAAASPGRPRRPAGWEWGRLSRLWRGGYGQEPAG